MKRPICLAAGLVLLISTAAMAADPVTEPPNSAAGIAVCNCPCDGDPNCDHVHTVTDVILTINVAFRGAAPVFDPDCPKERTNVNCDNVTDVIDIMKMIDVAFRAFPPAVCFCNSCNCPACNPMPTNPGGSLAVESKIVPPGTAGVQIGIAVANDVDITAIVMPLEIRSVTGGAYIANNLSLTVPAGNRVGASPIGAGFVTLRYYPLPDGTPCSGPVSNSYATAALAVDYVSPDGILWAGLSNADPPNNVLTAGADPPGTASASLLLTFDANANMGTFEIDTCCVAPGNHLMFVAGTGCNNPEIRQPAFTKGVITLCSCPCDGDPNCDGYVGAADMILTINVAFKGASPVTDPGCPKERTNVNCDNATDVIDLLKVVDVAYHGYSAAQCFCNSCDCLSCVPVPTSPGGSVVVESKIAPPGTAGVQIGISVANDVDINAVILPLEIRSVTGGAYIANNLAFNVPPANRVGSSPIGAGLLQYYATPSGTLCSGPTSNAYAAAAPAVDFVSPDGILWTGVNTGSGTLAAGTDPPGTLNASFNLVFDVNASMGTFEIDTCCVTPGNHLMFTAGPACDDREVRQPAFTKGVITLCNCPCDGDPECNGVVDVNDVVAAVNVAFRGGAPVFDPTCPKERTNVNCDDVTNILDVKLFICVAFQGYSPAQLFCNSCDCPSCQRPPLTPGGSVVVESKMVQKNAVGVQVGVSLTNEMDLTGIVLPLEFRTVSGGAYITNSLTLDVPPLNRVGSSPIAQLVADNHFFPVPDGNCSGPISNGYSTAGPVDFTSPDGLLWAGVSRAIPPNDVLPAGVDPPGTANASFLLTFDVNGSGGVFEIDTCCVAPGNHLLLLGAPGCDPPPHLPAFTKGVITICDCPCDGDPQCDGIHSVQDVVRTVDVAFRGVAPVFDPNCPKERTNVNCDDVTNIVDVIKMVCAAYKGYDPHVIFCNSCDCASCPPVQTNPGGSVVVESKTVPLGATGVQTGIAIGNDIDISAITLPLDIRTVTGGAYITNSLVLTVPPLNRVGASPIGQGSVSTLRYPVPAANSCSGPASNSYQTPATQVDFVSPDGVLLNAYSVATPPNDVLPAGVDPPGTANASFILVFDVTANPGTFEIDTGCVAPGNHLGFIGGSACETPEARLPSFTKGVITVVCSCPCLGDPYCDAITNVQDVVATVNVAFRNGVPIFDPACTSGNPAQRTDLNCDGVTTVLDVVHMVNVTFRGKAPAAEICNPCNCDPYPTNCPPLPQ